MKYLYKGMAMPSWGDSSWSVFLAWHEKVRVPTPSELNVLQLTLVRLRFVGS